MRWQPGPFTAAERAIVREVFRACAADGTHRNEALKARLPNRRLAHVYKVAIAIGVFVSTRKADVPKQATKTAAVADDISAPSIEDARDLALSGRSLVANGPPSRVPLSDRLPAFLADDFRRFKVIA